ncbi:MAG: gamma-glutamylcyclotransferase [Gammaproteobacteria bacterium]|nr:gamma-glutamylcyclotransferase [Gammaproteobacteria bacterium]
MRVFVYGTLRKGEKNHHWLSGARWLGDWRTPPRYALMDLGGYPGVRPGGRTAIRGEVYRLGPGILRQLDRLEAAPVEYRRILIRSPWGPAWIYLHRGDVRGRPLPGGDWLRRPAAARARRSRRRPPPGTTD